jgi:Fe-S oxidoreductase
MDLEQHIISESERLAALCTKCGACVLACPMTQYAPPVREADHVTIAAGMVDILKGGEGDELSRSWIAICTHSSACTPACPEHLDVAFMMRLAGLRARGAAGGKALIEVTEDKQHSPRIKAFARLTFTEQEQKSWL